MTIQLYANNAKTTLAAPINATQTTITVAPGTGALFPTPVSGVSAFKITLVSATSSSTYEICLCTARSTDTLTVIRGQEGTSGTPFILNDIVGNYDTAAVMTDLVQSEQLQTQYYQYAVATGTANALTATLPSNLTTITDGFTIILKSSAANTGAVSLTLTLGATILSSAPIVKGNNTALASGDIPAAGYPLSLTYSSTFAAWVLTDPTVVLSAYALINSQTFTGTPRVPTAPLNDNSTIIASTTWVQGQLANYAPIYSPTLTGSPAAPTASLGTNSTQIATTAFVSSALSAQKLGLGITGENWNNVAGSRSLSTTYTNSRTYPIVVSVSAGYPSYGTPGAIYVNGVCAALMYTNPNASSTFTTAIVPPGATYYATGLGSISNWAELY